jgi:outer membrane protein W
MRTFIRLMVVALAITVMGTIIPGSADAQYGTAGRQASRGGSWDFFMSPAYSPSATIDGQGGSKADLNSTWGLGLGLGYNFNDHFQLNGTFGWNTRNYEATVVDSTGKNLKYNNTMETFNLTLNGVFYFLKGDFSPFVSGGIGYSSWDTNIQNGPTQGSCWYDPWYGYVCTTYVPTKTSESFSYNAGLGIRYDVNRSFGMQAGYYKTWVDVSSASGTPDIDIWKLDFIFRFGM